jgi:hypothetical protein
MWANAAMAKSGPALATLLPLVASRPSRRSTLVTRLRPSTHLVPPLTSEAALFKNIATRMFCGGVKICSRQSGRCPLLFRDTWILHRQSPDGRCPPTTRLRVRRRVLGSRHVVVSLAVASDGDHNVFFMHSRRLLQRKAAAVSLGL